MLDVVFTALNLMVGFVFLYTTAALAVIGTAELIQRVILGPSKPSEGLEDGEVVRLCVPPLLTGLWLFMAWQWGLGMSV